ncbi:hypothetical protein GGF50DRAFT_116492 [Schizophyllum commune]
MRTRSRPSLRCLGSYKHPSSALPPQHNPQPLLLPPRPSHGRLRLENHPFIDPLFRHATTIYALTPSGAMCARWACWGVYWWFQRLIFTGIWVIGHEVRLDPIFVLPLLDACLPFAKLTSDPQTPQCGHGAFSDYKLLNEAVGFLRVSVFAMERDEVYVPETRADLGLPPADEARPVEYDEIMGDTPLYTPFVLVRQQLVAFPAYLLFNVSGQKTYPEATNHFDPKSTLFTPEQRTVVLSSNAGIGAKVIAAISASHVYSLAAVVKFYGIPWLLVTHWCQFHASRFVHPTYVPARRSTLLPRHPLTRPVIMITYLHHTTPELPHYRGREWDFQRGAAATVDPPFLGWQCRFFLHDVAHFHVVHHFFSKMPFYHGEEATKYLQAFIREHYAYSEKPIFEALWESYNQCQFVEDEGRSILCLLQRSLMYNQGQSSSTVSVRAEQRAEPPVYRKV